MSKLPILMMVFNRPELTKKVFSKVRKYKPKKLFISCDGPRKNIKNEKYICEEVKDIFKKIDWSCKVYKNYSRKNLGCKNKVSSSLKWFFDNVDKGIILEDDCLPSKSFFKFSEVLLKKYQNNKNVLLISGNNFQKNNWRGDGDYYFSKYPHIWGWATWKRSLKDYDKNIKNWKKWNKSKSCDQLFDHMLKKEKDYWINIFNKTYKNKIDTWDYQLMLGGWIKDQYSIIPNINLVSHIGMGPKATHSIYPKEKKGERHFELISKIKHPIIKSVNHKADTYCWLRSPYQGIFLYFPFNILSVIWIKFNKFFFRIVSS